MLSVNAHDQVAGLDVGAADAQAFRELQAENQRLKEAIEQAWDNAGLPTFLRYLREYIQGQSRDVADGAVSRPVRRYRPISHPTGSVGRSSDRRRRVYDA